MKDKKVVIIGAGALRTIRLVHGAMELSRQFGRSRIVLMDLNRQRAEAVERLCRLMPQFDPQAVELSVEDRFEQAIDGADCVYVVVRLDGAQEGWDKGVCLRHGYHGDDTYGPSAIMLGLRTGAVLLKMAREMEKRCPDAWLCVFSNPVTMNTDMLSRYTKIKTLGLCGGVENFRLDMEHLHFDPPGGLEGLSYRGAGLNHFSWVAPGSTYKGECVYDYLRRYLPTVDQRKIVPWCLWPYESRVFEMTGRMPMNNGHFYHYFMYDEVVAEESKGFLTPPPAAAPAVPALPCPADPWQKRFELSRRTAIDDYWTTLGFTVDDLVRTEVGLRAVWSMWYDQGWEIGANVPNRGHAVGLPNGAVVEATCRMTARGAEPLGIDAIPPMLKGLMPAVAYQQRMVADLIVNPSKKGLIDAVFADPCHRSLKSTYAIADELWAAFEQNRKPQGVVK
jgi:alpha-galactosidase/6-phospho-beta-glucosidase family protein